MFFVYFVVALNHIKQIIPPVCQVLQLSSSYSCLKTVLEEDSVVELDVKVNGLLVKIADTKGDDSVLTWKCRILFELSSNRPGIFVNGLILDYMEIVQGCFTSYWDLVSTIFFDALVKALNLVSG